MRLAAALGVGAATTALLPSRLGQAMRIVAGWDAAAVVVGILTLALVGRASAAETRAHAAAEDPGRAAVSLSVLATCVFSLFATAVALRQADRCPPDLRPLFIGLCLLGVAAAWALTHAVYTLRYAHLYYRDGVEHEGGLAFPGDAHPCYVDFAYFAFTVGMCFQVSDVAVTSASLRRTALGHAVLSFTYNTAILAVALNLAIGAF